jgi:hypothetical protein
MPIAQNFIIIINFAVVVNNLQNIFSYFGLVCVEKFYLAKKQLQFYFLIKANFIKVVNKKHCK